MNKSKLTEALNATLLTLWTLGLSGCATVGNTISPAQQQSSTAKVLHAIDAKPVSADSLPYVAQILKGRPAEKAGIQEGDLIVAINGQPTQSTQEASDLLAKITSEPVSFTIRRNGTEQEIVVPPATTQPRLGIGLWHLNTLYLESGSGGVTMHMENYSFAARLVESNEGILLVEVGIFNTFDHSITISPDVLSVRAYSVALQRLSAEEAMNFNYGPALATLNVSSGELGTYISQTVVTPPPQPSPAYQIESRTSTYGHMTYGTATARPVPSSGGFVQGFMDARAANQAAMAQAMPYLIQRQLQINREQLIQQYTKELTEFQRRYLRTTSVPPGGRYDGVVFYDNVRRSRPLELVVEIEGSRQSVLFGD